MRGSSLTAPVPQCTYCPFLNSDVFAGRILSTKARSWRVCISRAKAYGIQPFVVILAELELAMLPPMDLILGDGSVCTVAIADKRMDRSEMRAAWNLPCSTFSSTCLRISWRISYFSIFVSVLLSILQIGISIHKYAFLFDCSYHSFSAFS